ncbi:MAG TPA: type II toxin-antitoxin system VapC family toxin [Candidatus Sulfotelmatobacter sp.]|nr:type II toxin-antitoxin system VapC family toxin [Candidatus Sulfotelmatobacter sp.]
MLYVDSSALVKHYIREPGTDAINAKLSAESMHQKGVFISTVGYAEILATFARRFRENLLQKREADLLPKEFRDDWMFELAHVELTVGVLGFIPRLVKDYPLRGSDAIHLASALWLRDAARLGLHSGAAIRSLTFATSDKQLKNAASAEGLAVFDPEDEA